MTTLADFLLARIAEDEAAAREIPAGTWEDATQASWRYDHVFRWSPERVLADCAAKRAIVEMHALMDGGDPDSFPYESEDGRTVWPGCVICDGDSTPRRLGCDTVRHLAAPYADHPDYDPTWKVEP